jgi:putative ubiquitin-RnfH superfamily antitoxin RatB of RatAB toxin-antitoxin module
MLPPVPAHPSISAQPTAPEQPSIPAPPSRPTEISVEVSYAEPQRAVVKTYRLGSAASVGDALRLAAADPDFAGVDLAHSAVGIFGKLAPASQLLNGGDRVEIYRPLAADPKSARRARAREARKRT